MRKPVAFYDRAELQKITRRFRRLVASTLGVDVAVSDEVARSMRLSRAPAVASGRGRPKGKDMLSKYRQAAMVAAWLCLRDYPNMTQTLIARQFNVTRTSVCQAMKRARNDAHLAQTALKLQRAWFDQERGNA